MEFYQKHIMKLQRSMNRWADSSRIRRIIRLANLSSYTWVTLFLLMLASCKVTHVVKCECKCPHITYPSSPFNPTWDYPFKPTWDVPIKEPDYIFINKIDTTCPIIWLNDTNQIHRIKLN
jgi:hypothetical protein